MAKALSMSILFRAEHYGNIVAILNRKETLEENAFNNALMEEFSSAGLDKADQEWLANYMKHYDKDLAAASDAKWPVHPDARSLHW